jgi:hypothetical protein
MWNEKYGTDWKQQKDCLFERKEVDSVPQLLAELRQLKNNGFYFRGQSSALFRITSSIQRAWHKGESWRKNVPRLTFPQFSKGLLKFVRSDIFVKYNRLHLMDHEIWANLQHNCCPTPLIDFSNNQFVALHFATSHFSEAEGYCSIYAMYPEGLTGNGWNDVLYLEEFLKDAYEREVECDKMSGAKSVCKGVRFVKENNFEHWGFLDKTGHGTELAPVDYMPKDGVTFLIKKNLKEWCKKIVCDRMKLQEGLFIYAPIEDESLEDFIFRKWKKITADGETNDLIYQPLKCFDIPERLVKEICRVVKGEGFSDERLGLEPNGEENEVKSMYGAYLNGI